MSDILDLLDKAGISSGRVALVLLVIRLVPILWRDARSWAQSEGLPIYHTVVNAGGLATIWRSFIGIHHGESQISNLKSQIVSCGPIGQGIQLAGATYPSDSKPIPRQESNQPKEKQ